MIQRGDGSFVRSFSPIKFNGPEKACAYGFGQPVLPLVAMFLPNSMAEKRVKAERMENKREYICIYINTVSFHVHTY